VVLQHVAQRAGAIVVIGTILDADRLGHGDLHMVDEVAVPQGLDQRVGKTEDEQVLHRLLAEKVIDAVDLLLVEMLVQQAIEHLRRFEIFAKWLFDHHTVQAARLVESRGFEVLDHCAEFRRLDSKIEHRT
jgi:hypothetical protein